MFSRKRGEKGRKKRDLRGSLKKAYLSSVPEEERKAKKFL
jgi:hypothetical protein